MTGFLDAVREKITPKCLSRKCSRPGCRVPLKDAPYPRLIIDFDKPGSPLGERATRCDFLFIAEEDDKSAWVAPLELKGRLDVSRAVQQLQAGARAAEGLIPQNAKVNFRPVVAFKGIPKAERVALRSRVRFHEQTEALRLIKCGAPLIQALRQ